MDKKFPRSFIGYKSRKVYKKMKEIDSHYNEVFNVYKSIEEDLKKENEKLKREIELAKIKRDMDKKFKESVYKTLYEINAEVTADRTKDIK